MYSSIIKIKNKILRLKDKKDNYDAVNLKQVLNKIKKSIKNTFKLYNNTFLIKIRIHYK